MSIKSYVFSKVAPKDVLRILKEDGGPVAHTVNDRILISCSQDVDTDTVNKAIAVLEGRVYVRKKRSRKKKQEGLI